MKKFLALFSVFLLSIFSVQTVLAEDEDDEDEYEYEYENDEEDEDEVTPIIEITTAPTTSTPEPVQETVTTQTQTTTIKQVVIPDIVVTDDDENGIVDAVEELFYK